MTLSQDYWDDTVYDTRPSFLDGLSVDPSERYGAPVLRHSKSQMAFRFVCAIALTGAWTAFVTSGELVRFAPVAQSAIATVLDKASELAARLDHRQKAPENSIAHAEAAAGASSDPQGDARALPEIPVVQVAAPEPAEVKGADYAENAPPPVDDPAIAPQRKKAAAAGLGPDLPNVLLSRLSKVDFQNAAYAIKTALAKTADDAKFSWPLAPSREQALFEVRFVTGAASGCRRYVVTVTKDRWSSNTSAVEKCGSVVARAN
jgi:hypothetical protein